MSTLRCMVLVFLGIAFCGGCGDSQQSWEGGKSQSSAQKKSAKGDEVKDNDVAESTTDSENPHKATNPHGAMNPHEGMQMPTEAADEALENNGKLDLDTAHWTVPKSWIRKTPKSPILQAEYGVPKAEGDKDDGRLTISQARGSVEDNIARWKSQFSKKLDQEKQETIDANGVKVTLVDLTGTFDDARGMMGPTITRPDYRMLGAIFQVPGEEGLHFVKCYGPAKTIAARADEVKGFLKSLKVEK